MEGSRWGGSGRDEEGFGGGEVGGRWGGGEVMMGVMCWGGEVVEWGVE